MTDAAGRQSVRQSLWHLRCFRCVKQIKLIVGVPRAFNFLTFSVDMHTMPRNVYKDNGSKLGRGGGTPLFVPTDLASLSSPWHLHYHIPPFTRPLSSYLYLYSFFLPLKNNFFTILGEIVCPHRRIPDRCGRLLRLLDLIREANRC